METAAFGDGDAELGQLISVLHKYTLAVSRRSVSASRTLCAIYTSGHPKIVGLMWGTLRNSAVRNVACSDVFIPGVVYVGSRPFPVV